MPVTLEEHLAALENPRETLLSHGVTPAQFARDLKKLLRTAKTEKDLVSVARALNLEADVLGLKLQRVTLNGKLEHGGNLMLAVQRAMKEEADNG